jgi:hypothetical protein
MDGLPAMQESEGLEMCNFLMPKPHAQKPCVLSRKRNRNLVGFSNAVILTVSEQLAS